MKLAHEIELNLNTGEDVASEYRSVGICDATHYNWLNRFGEMGHARLPEMKSMEKVRARLKKLLAELELDKLILKETLNHRKPRGRTH